MNICFISRVFPPKIGGSGSFLEVLTNSLSKKGFNVTVVTTKTSKTRKFEKKNGVKIFREFSFEGKLEYSSINYGLSTLALTKRILQNSDNDLFHSHDMSIGALSGTLAKKFINKPFLLKFGGDLVFEYLAMNQFPGFKPQNGLEETFKFRKGMPGLIHKIQDWFFNTYDLVIPDAYYGKEYLIKRGLQPEKIHTIPNGVNIKQFKPEKSSFIQEKLNLNGFIIFSAGRMFEWKGFNILIKALKKVLEKHKNIYLVLGGSGPYQKKFELEAKKLRIKKNVFFVGKIPRNEMINYFNSCDLFVLPSFFDSTPNILLEAMACKKAVLVSNIPGMQEVIKENSGLKAKVADPNDFAKKILEIIEKTSLKKKLESNAIKRIKKEYTQKVVINRYIDLYEKVI